MYVGLFWNTQVLKVTELLLAPRAQFLSKPYFLLLGVSLRAQDVKVLKEYFILTVYTFFLFFLISLSPLFLFDSNDIADGRV